MANIAITVSHENHEAIPALYDELVHRRGVRSITAVIVRDEGVHTVPAGHREAIAAAHRALTTRISEDQRSGVLDGYDPSTVQGRVMNRKNEILWDVIADTYVEPHYVSPCQAGALFGVIDADGTVHACEVLDAPIGNLRDHGMDLEALWRGAEASNLRRWIRDTHCNCSYECALGFTVLASRRYQPRLAAAALGR
jgi:radical SAM protein with 4Fe4S-binding SPASM domain